jgi:exocyst complex component 4
MATQEPTKSRLSRFLFNLAIKPNDAPPEAAAGHAMPITVAPSSDPNSDSSRSPESDSFAYMEMLLESLAVLGKLGSGLDTIAQRLPIEIYSLVEATIDEVNDRTEFSKRLANVSSTAAVVGPAQAASAYIYVHRKAKLPPTTRRMLELERAEMAGSLRMAALESSAKEADHEVLRDLFWTLYSKLDAVTQSLRVVYELANRIGSVSGGLGLCLVVVVDQVAYAEERLSRFLRGQTWLYLPTPRTLDTHPV